MAKFYGPIGFSHTKEVRPGYWEDQITEHMYYGEVIRNTRRLQSTDQVNDNINVSNEISIIADPFACNNIYAMRYVRFMGARWKISNVEVQYPRLTLTIGGLYNGPDGPETCAP